MSLADLIRGKKLEKVGTATATVATFATLDPGNVSKTIPIPPTVATVATVSVATPEKKEISGDPQTVAPTDEPTDLGAELDRLQHAVLWVVKVADLGTVQERSELSRLIDLGMTAEATMDLPTIQQVARELSRIAWAIGARVRGSAGDEEDLLEREALQNEQTH